MKLNHNFNEAQGCWKRAIESMESQHVQLSLLNLVLIALTVSTFYNQFELGRLDLLVLCRNPKSCSRNLLILSNHDIVSHEEPIH